jgi:hypothetical protein
LDLQPVRPNSDFCHTSPDLPVWELYNLVQAGLLEADQASISLLDPVYRHSCTATHVPSLMYRHSCTATHVPPLMYRHSCTVNHLPPLMYRHSCTVTHVPPLMYRHSIVGVDVGGTRTSLAREKYCPPTNFWDAYPHLCSWTSSGRLQASQ